MTESRNIREIIKVNYFQPAFLICAGILAITASAMSAVIKLSGIYLKKDPLPLKNPLSKLDGFDLAPYKVIAKQRIENPDVLETLGTAEDYIQWVLEDTTASKADSGRFCSLFITYYQLPDVVPHRPEECYIGGGFELTRSEDVTLTIPATSSGTGDSASPAANGIRQIDARYLVFSKTSQALLAGEAIIPVLYIFSVNGEYARGRDHARRILNKNLFGKFSYFSKVEWKFYGNDLERIIYPDKQQALSASEKLLKVILPVLEKEHWPSGLWCL